MKVSSKRAEYVALTGLILSLVFFGAAWFLGDWSKSFAIYALSWQLLGGGLVWVILAIYFHQIGFVEQEKLDIAKLTKGEGAEGIFTGTSEQAAVFAVAQRRLELFEKWVLPIFSGLIAIYYGSIGIYLIRRLQVQAEAEPQNVLVSLVYMAGMAFVSFLISRYATGMSAEAEWRPLKSGGSNLLASAILAFAIAIGLGWAHFKVTRVLAILDWVAPVLMCVLAVETALNVIMDIYRPRLKGQYHRAAFDSRLLGLISEPGGILNTAATAIDYQFGFKVSQTWFYKLLEKAVMPLILFSAFCLYAASSIVVIRPGEEAIIEHFGRPIANTVKPGISLKWPWPIDIVNKYPVRQIQQINIGFVPETDERLQRRPLLWGESHYKLEYNLLVATETGGEQTNSSVPAVSLIRAAVPVQYRIKNLYDFIYNHNDSERMLETICYRELARFAASAKIEAGEGSGGDQSLLGAGRTDAAEILIKRIQNASDEAGLGVEIVFLGLQGIHPPPEVAPEYQRVVGAVQIKKAFILLAMAERNRILTSMAGSVEQANQLYQLAQKYQAMKEKSEPEAEKLAAELDTAFGQAKGDIFAALSTAKSEAFEKATIAKATGERFKSQVQAYRAAKDIYRREQQMGMLEEALEKTRKYVIVADANDTEVYSIDLQEKLTPSLYDITTTQEGK